MPAGEVKKVKLVKLLSVIYNKYMSDNQNTIPTGTRDQAALAAFVEQVIKEKNDPDITPEKMPAVVEALFDELNDQINTHMINILPDEKRKELEAILDSDAPDSDIDTFFEKNIPNLESEITAVLLNFRAGYLAAIKPGPILPREDEMLAEEAPVNAETPTPEDESLMPAPPAPSSHTPFDGTQIASDKAPNLEDKAWN